MLMLFILSFDSNKLICIYEIEFVYVFVYALFYRNCSNDKMEEKYSTNQIMASERNKKNGKHYHSTNTERAQKSSVVSVDDFV